MNNEEIKSFMKLNNTDITDQFKHETQILHTNKQDRCESIVEHADK